MVGLGCVGGSVEQADARMAVASSLRVVMPGLVQAYVEKNPSVRFQITYGASGSLARQIEAGAPADLAVFAGRKPARRLIQHGLASADGVSVLAKNRLVLIGRTGTGPMGFRELHRSSDGRIAMGHPDFVPAGQYARSALQALGIWSEVQGRLLYGSDVSAVLAYTRRGEVSAGIVYWTEARRFDDVVVLDQAVKPWAPRIEVVGVPLKSTDSDPLIAEFLEFLQSQAAAEHWIRHGFVVD